MAIGLITITHDGIGEALVESALSIIRAPAVEFRHFAFTSSDAVQVIQAEVESALADLDHGNGVLILTDLYGSTPCNIAERLATNHRIGVLSGVNLAMVLRVFTYSHLDMQAIVQRAWEGGRMGIIDCTPAGARSLSS